MINMPDPLILQLEIVFLFKPAERTGEKRKLARAYHRPYRVIKLTSNNAHIRRVNRPEDATLGGNG